MRSNARIEKIDKKFNERLLKMIKDGLIERSYDERYLFTPSFQKLVDDCTKECMVEQHKFDEIDKKIGNPPGTLDAIELAVIKAYSKAIKQGRLENVDVDVDILLLIRGRQMIKPVNHFPDGIHQNTRR